MPSLSTVTGRLDPRVDPYQAFNFLVEIEGIISGGFSECSGLQAETAFTDYEEGGRNDYVHRFAGITKYPPLVLRHGLTPGVDGLWDWHQEVVQGKITRRNGTIYLYDKQRRLVMCWHFNGALPVKWSGPDLRADSGSIAVESIELTHRGLSRPELAGFSDDPALQSGN